MLTGQAVVMLIPAPQQAAIVSCNFYLALNLLIRIANLVKLSDKWMRELLSKPETGMDYYVASVILHSGIRFDQVIISSGIITLIRNFDSIPFTEEDIEQIIVTHDKWKWR
mgnify:CR=1 FL=1